MKGPSQLPGCKIEVPELLHNLLDRTHPPLAMTPQKRINIYIEKQKKKKKKKKSRNRGRGGTRSGRQRCGPHRRATHGQKGEGGKTGARVKQLTHRPPRPLGPAA